MYASPYPTLLELVVLTVTEQAADGVTTTLNEDDGEPDPDHA